MLRQRLTLALTVLALAAVMEGLMALWALNVAAQHLERGRVVGDIQLGFVELSVTKQRLRTWVSQRQLDAGAQPAERERLLRSMRDTLARLQSLAQRAATLDPGTETRTEHLQRLDALAVLTGSVDALAREIERVQPLRAGTDALNAWDALNERFDMSDGRDLRELLAQGSAREAAAVQRERQAADRTLAWMRTLWMAAASSLALGALLLAAYLTRALRLPLERLSAGALALQRGDLDHRIPEQGCDEFAAVARSVNTMAAELALHRTAERQTRQRLEEQVQARTAELQGALQTLRDVDARRRQLFADISHELRTPTTAIRGEAEITLRGQAKPPAEYQAALRRIVDTSGQLGLVINDLLTMARSDIDALALQRRAIDLAPVLSEALEQVQALAHERRVKIHTTPLPEVPLPLLADPQRLRQLITLLLDNAIRYSAPGGEVRVRVLPADDTTQRCVVEVRNGGIDIAPDELPHVFERNFRGERARRHRADGSGLGLAIGQALARAHGGEIRLSSDPIQGTTAALWLPITPYLEPDET
ncbi:MAG: two-component system OmpR family sensor kinase [Hydrogenophaga sp.]|jgi:two-component system OmpR family sensor kinase